MKTKLAHKVVIAITIPVIFQICFFWYLLNSVKDLDALENAEREAAQTLMLRDQMYVAESKQLLYYGFYRATRNQEYKDKFRDMELSNQEAFRQLKRKWNGDNVKLHILKIAWLGHKMTDKFGQLMFTEERQHTFSGLIGGPLTIPAISSVLAANDRGNLNLLFDEMERSQSDLQKESNAKEAELKLGLILALIASILISLASGLLFSKSIADRLKKVVGNIKAMESHDKPLVNVAGKDEIEELNSAIVDTDRKIREAEEFQAQTARIVAQELERPIDKLSTSIVELQQDGFESMTDNGKERVERSLLEITRLRTLVRDLVSLDKICQAGWDLDITSVDLAEIARGAVDTVQDFAASVGVGISCNFVECRVQGDPARLQQIALNLLTNAIKFSRRKTTINVVTSIESGFGKLSVTDHGTGIPEEFQQSIFGKFEQAARTDSTEKGGSGLGLAISKKLVESQQGKMGFRSKLGEGSTFWLMLPAGDAAVAIDTKVVSAPLSPAPEKENEIAPGFRSTLWKKGVMLVVLPIVLQVATIGVLWGVIGAIRDNVNEFYRVTQIASYHSRLVNGIVRGAFFSMLYNIEPYPQYKQGVEIEQKVIAQMLEKINNISQSDKTLAANAGTLTKTVGEHIQMQEEILAANQDASIDPWFGPKTIVETENKANRLLVPLQEALARENKLIEENTLAKLEMRNSVEKVILTSILSAFFMSAMLGALMARGLTSRVQRIVDNTRRLVEKEPLVAPLGGADEIAYVDQSFFDAGNRLIQLERFKQEIVAITSHEFRTPLSSLLAKADLMEAGVFGPLNKKGMEIVVTVKRSISDLIVLITNLLDVEKVQSGKNIVAKGPALVDDILKNTAQNVAELAKDKQVEIQANASELSAEVDATRMVQSLTAVLADITEHAPPHSSIKLDAAQAGNVLAVTIAAPGADCSKESLNSASARGRLAVDLLRLITEQHGGSINIDASESQLLVHVKLPQAA